METLNLPLYPSVETSTKLTSSFNPLSSLETSLNSIFPTNAEESKLSATKRNLGETANKLTDEQVECMVTDFQHLIDTWLDEFEADVFEGKTLKELLGGKSYADTKQK
jgi:hypothetical protein